MQMYILLVSVLANGERKQRDFAIINKLRIMITRVDSLLTSVLYFLLLNLTSVHVYSLCCSKWVSTSTTAWPIWSYLNSSPIVCGMP